MDHRCTRVGDIGWTVTEGRWEFEDGSYLPVRGLWSCIARTASGSSSLGSQHPRSPTNCFDQDHWSHSQPAPPPGLPALSESGFFSIVADRHVPVPAAAGLTGAEPGDRDRSPPRSRRRGTRARPGRAPARVVPISPRTRRGSLLGVLECLLRRDPLPKSDSLRSREREVRFAAYIAAHRQPQSCSHWAFIREEQTVPVHHRRRR